MLHGRHVRNEQTLLWVKGFAAMTSVTNSAPLRFLSSSTLNGCVMDYHAANIASAVLEDGVTRDGNWDQKIMNL